jgi:pimeloyl-ACP methyl ester carboxylesterase
MESQVQQAPSAARRKIVGLLERGVDEGYERLRDTIRVAGLAHAVAQRNFEGSVAPALGSLLQMQQDLVGSVLGCLRGDRRWRDAGLEAWHRVRAGSRYERLVSTWGRELFGSARFEGERVLVEDDLLRLVHIPPAAGGAEPPFALFHAGTGLPYSDRLFRLLPETNFFDRFRERGVPVYAMELRGDRHTIDYAGLTIERLIDTIERFTTVAFEHNAGRKLVLEGYCAHGMQSLAYVAARPEEAARKLCAIATFVAPIDGTECRELSEITMLMPQPWIDANFVLWRLAGGYVPGDSLRTGLDLSLRTTFHKTPLGYFHAGWNQQALAAARGIADLKTAERRDLAGAYWISPENANRFPIPVDFARFATGLFRQGIAKDGTIPFSYRGAPLSLRAIRERTRLPVVGFYGGRDVMVPDRTAYVLLSLLGDRYRHVVHPQAGHISYVLSPRMWSAADARALRPNPIDEIAAVAA